jgi:hypothetical protein
VKLLIVSLHGLAAAILSSTPTAAVGAAAVAAVAVALSGNEHQTWFERLNSVYNML